MMFGLTGRTENPRVWKIITKTLEKGNKLALTSNCPIPLSVQPDNVVNPTYFKLLILLDSVIKV